MRGAELAASGHGFVFSDHIAATIIFTAEPQLPPCLTVLLPSVTALLVTKEVMGPEPWAPWPYPAPLFQNSRLAY